MGESLTNKPKPLIVELVGLPGAGKTTVSQQVALKLRERGLQIVSRDEILKQWKQKNLLQKAIQLLPNNLNHCNILINSLVFAFQVKPINLQSFSKAAKIFTNVSRNDTVARAHDCEIILLDQGLLQETWSVGITGSPPQTKYLKWEMMPLFHNRSTIILYFQVEIETALYRIQHRQTMTSRFDLMDSKQAYSILEKYSLYLDKIINCARTCDIPIVEVDSSLSIEEQSDQTVSRIINFLGRCRT